MGPCFRRRQLAAEPRPGAPRKITDEAVEELIVATLERHPGDATHWSRASMAEATGLQLATHKAPAEATWLDAHPRFHTHHTPTYSSWLNQVERWLGLLTDKQLRRGTHRSIQALDKDIRGWIKTWNENPKPFAWTKTADEILERLASYLHRIPGAGH